jgi:hypothetical protein
MKIQRIMMTGAACAALLIIPLSAFAQQNSTQTGRVNATGQAQSLSASEARSLAISRGGAGGTGGSATATGGAARASGGSNSLTFNSPAQVRTDSVATTVQRNRSSGSLRTTANAIAPQLVASAVGTCLGSVSSGVGATGFGFSFGTTVPDKSCDLRMFSEALLKVGQRNAATAVLCLDPNAYAAFQAVGIACPLVPAGYQVVGQPAGTQPYQLLPPEPEPAYAPVRYRKGKRIKTDVVPTGNTYAPVPVSELPRVISETPVLVDSRYQ